MNKNQRNRFPEMSHWEDALNSSVVLSLTEQDLVWVGVSNELFDFPVTRQACSYKPVYMSLFQLWQLHGCVHSCMKHHYNQIIYKCMTFLVITLWLNGHTLCSGPTLKFRSEAESSHNFQYHWLMYFSGKYLRELQRPTNVILNIQTYIFQTYSDNILCTSYAQTLTLTWLHTPAYTSWGWWGVPLSPSPLTQYTQQSGDPVMC